jgi:cytochrome P450 family 6
MEISLLILAATVLILWFVHSIRKKYDYFKERGIPNPKPYWPLGNFWKVGMSVHFINRVNEIYRQFKGSAKVCGFYIFTIPVYIVLDIDLIKNILVKDFDSFHDRGKLIRREDTH